MRYGTALRRRRQRRRRRRRPRKATAARRTTISRRRSSKSWRRCSSRTPSRPRRTMIRRHVSPCWTRIQSAVRFFDDLPQYAFCNVRRLWTLIRSPSDSCRMSPRMASHVVDMCSGSHRYASCAARISRPLKPQRPKRWRLRSQRANHAR